MERMPYEYLDDIAIADVAFRAWSESLEGLFVAAAEAALNVMVDNPESIRDAIRREIRLSADSIEMLLFELLQELIYWKDAEQQLMRVSDVRISAADGGFSIACLGRGETMDPSRHALLVDVKAVTLHRFLVHPTSDGWEATVVLDI